MTAAVLATATQLHDVRDKGAAATAATALIVDKESAADVTVKCTESEVKID